MFGEAKSLSPVKINRMFLRMMEDTLFSPVNMQKVKKKTPPSFVSINRDVLAFSENISTEEGLLKAANVCVTLGEIL